MIRSLSFLAPLLAALCLAQLARSQPEKRSAMTDLAELVPDSTLAYLELKHPPLMKEIRELIKGSGLEDYAAFRDEHAPKDRERRFFDEGAVLAFIFTPEFLDELARFNQHAVALAGFDKDGKPRSAWIMDAGDSNIPNLIVRDVLTLVSSFRTVDTVEGVRLYQQKRHFDERQQLFPSPPSPVIALMPRRFVIGTDVETVRDIVLRWKGKKEGKSLASSKEFKAAADLRQKPGMFAYARLDKIFGKDGPLVRDRRAPWAFDTFFAAEPIFLNAAMFFDPQTVERGVAYLGIDDGGLELQMRFSTPADGTSPLAALMGSRPASHRLLHYAPKHSALAMTAALAGKADAWADAMKQLDPIAKKYNIAHPLTRKEIEAAFAEAKIDPAKDIFARVANVGWAGVPTGRGEPGVAVMIEAVDAGAAEKLEGMWKALGQKAPEDLRRLELRRAGKVLVLAPTAKEAEAALAAGDKGDGFAARPEVAAVLKGATGAKVLGVWSVQSMIELQLMTTPWLKTAAVDLPKRIEKLPAGEMSVTSGKDHVLFRMRQADLRGPARHLIDAFLLNQLLGPADNRFR